VNFKKTKFSELYLDSKLIRSF